MATIFVGTEDKGLSPAPGPYMSLLLYYYVTATMVGVVCQFARSVSV